MQSAVDQFVKLSGKELPTKIALKVFPADFIPDPKAVAEEMDKKAEEAEKLFQDNLDKADAAKEEPAVDADA
jgi:hypothetical protein